MAPSLKFTQITASLVNFTTADVLIGVQNGTFDRTFTRAQLQSSFLDMALIVTATISSSTIGTSTISNSTISTSTISSSIISTSTINNSTINTATINNSTLNTATLNTATIINSTINTATISSSTINASTINNSILNTAILNTATIVSPAVSGGSIANTIISYTTPINFYVAISGSDSTGDGSLTNPWRTTDHACTYIRANYRTDVVRSNTDSIIINVGVGTFTDKVHIDYLFNVSIIGAGVTTIWDTNQNGIFSSFGPCYVNIDDLKIQNTGSPGNGKGIYTNWDGATVFIGGITFGTGLAVQLAAEVNSRIVVSANSLTIAGGASNFIFCGSNAHVDITGGSTITITGTPAFSDCFIWSADNATVFVESDTTFTGGATGKRFRVSNGGDIATSPTEAIGDTAGLTFLPGDAAGEGWAGGNYDGYVFDTNQNELPNTQTATTYTVVNTDEVIIINHASTATLTLPTASSWPARRLLTKTLLSAVVSTTANVVPLIGGSASTAILAATPGRWAEMYSDGTNWVIVASN